MIEFEWNIDKARTNIIKHKVSFEEAMRVFDDPFAIYFQDDFHSSNEDRFIVRGYSDSNLLIVNFTYRNNKTRIISARKATNKERKQHEK